MKKNVAGQTVSCQMVSATDGSNFTGAVTVYVTGDAGTQAAGSVGSGACTHEGKGLHSYAPAQAETNYDNVCFTFEGTGAVTATVQIYTSFPQTGDNYARLGAPAGASVSADIAAVKTQTAAIETDTAEIGAAGAGLTNINLPDQTMNITGNITGNLSGSVGSVTGAVGSVTGNVGGNVTGTIGGLTAAALKDFFDTDTTTTYASAVAGSVVKEIADNAGGSSLTLADIADAVWDEATAGHAGAGTTGKALTDAGSAGDPWSTALPGAYGAGTAGKIIGDNIDAAISSRLAASSNGSGLSAIPWNSAWDAEVQSEVDDALVAQNLDHLVKSAVDTDFATTVHANSVIGHIADNGAGFDRTTDSLEAIRDRGDAAWITATGFSTHSAADVWAVATSALTVLDEDSTTLDLDATIRSAVGLAAANLDTQLTAIDDAIDTEVGAIKTKTDQLTFTNANQVDATAISISNNAIGASTISAAGQNAIADAILDRNMTTGTDSGSTTVRTVRQALRSLRNKVAISAGTATVYKEDDSTSSWTAAVTTTAGNPISAIDPAGP